MAPIYPIYAYGADGTPILDGQGTGTYDYGAADAATGKSSRPYGLIMNPVATLLNDQMKHTNDNLFTSSYFDFNFLKDFNFKYTYS